MVEKKKKNRKYPVEKNIRNIIFDGCFVNLIFKIYNISLGKISQIFLHR